MYTIAKHNGNLIIWWMCFNVVVKSTFCIYEIIYVPESIVSVLLYTFSIIHLCTICIFYISAAFLSPCLITKCKTWTYSDLKINTSLAGLFHWTNKSVTWTGLYYRLCHISIFQFLLHMFIHIMKGLLSKVCIYIPFFLNIIFPFVRTCVVLLRLFEAETKGSSLRPSTFTAVRFHDLAITGRLIPPGPHVPRGRCSRCQIRVIWLIGLFITWMGQFELDGPTRPVEAARWSSSVEEVGFLSQSMPVEVRDPCVSSGRSIVPEVCYWSAHLIFLTWLYALNNPIYTSCQPLLAEEVKESEETHHRSKINY